MIGSGSCYQGDWHVILICCFSLYCCCCFMGSVQERASNQPPMLVSLGPHNTTLQTLSRIGCNVFGRVWPPSELPRVKLLQNSVGTIVLCTVKLICHHWTSDIITHWRKKFWMHVLNLWPWPRKWFKVDLYCSVSPPGCYNLQQKCHVQRLTSLVILIYWSVKRDIVAFQSSWSN